MIDHQLTTDLYDDQKAEVLALSFKTGRVIIRWGSGLESCLSALRFDRDVGAWRRETCPRGYRHDALAGPAGVRYCRDLGLIEGPVSVQPAGANAVGPVVAWLARESGLLPTRFARGSTSELRGIASWLMESRRSRSLPHGCDLIEHIAAEGGPAVGGGGRFDDLLGVLVALEILYPHAFMPRPGAIFQNDAWQARAFGKRVAPETFGGVKCGPAGERPEGWEPGTACGAKHWLFQQGSRFLECVGNA